MKDNLFEMLLNLFEKSLTQLRNDYTPKQENSDASEETEPVDPQNERLFIRSAEANTTRVLTYEEQMKLTKASYQFLARMKLYNIIDHDIFEEVMNLLGNSDSRIITLQETKWAIRTVLSRYLTEDQLSFLELVLYQEEDQTIAH